jgi:hypothetical protein
LELQRDKSATCSPFPAATDLGLTGLLFPLLKPMFRMSGNPAIRQKRFQGGDVVRGDGSDPTQHIEFGDTIPVMAE